MSLKAPFPYFGGKSSIAAQVWDALGQPRHYLEPFFGSGAVLLSRPGYDPMRHVESVCDKDGFLANVWRALQFSPDEVARWCDWPVNHADLSARKAALLRHKDGLLDSLIADERWHDPVMAGYWIWAASCWIGSGLTSLGQRPHLSNGGEGVHALGKRPHLSDGGNGVHALGTRPHLSDGGSGVQEPYNSNLYTWFRAISERLRHVRVVCGDWTRICGGHWQVHMGTVGMFFDPPYAVADRDQALYDQESSTVALDVQRWCLERGTDPAYRIVLAGYDEHQALLAHGWTTHAWTARSGYANQGHRRGNVNRHRETLYLSPHCMRQELFVSVERARDSADAT